MATTIFTPVGALYVDNNRFDNTGTGLDLINTVPEAEEIEVLTTAPVNLWIIAYGTSAIAGAKVYINRDGQRLLAYDQAGSGIQAGWLGSVAIQASPGSTVNDEIVLSLTPAVPFTSLDRIIVEVEATAGSDALDASYAFTIQDLSPPNVDEILWRNPRQARLRFNKIMQQDADAGGTLYRQVISGAMEYVAPDQVRLSALTPTNALIGYWLGMTGSAYPGNNGYFKITAVDPVDKLITVDTGTVPFKDDDGVDKDIDGNIVRRRNLRGFVTSYRFEGRPQDEEEIECSYEPLINSIREPLLEEIPQNADIRQYLIIDLHDDISIGRMYRFHTAMAKDLLGNAAGDTSTFDFVSPLFGSPPTRITMWDLIPAPVQDEDLRHTGELRKMCCILQDGLNQLWYRADSLAHLNDPDLAPPQWVDYLLYSLGNPFKFPLTPLGKRRLIAVLVAIYKRMGTEKGIEDALAFFLGIQFDVRPFMTADWWILGQGILGLTTVLGPDSAFARNAYEIISPVRLTEEQARIVREVATTLDPAYMHLIRIVEPGEVPGTVAFWTVGSAGLGVSTVLT